MSGEQCIGVQREAVNGGGLAQHIEETAPVGVVDREERTVVGALNDQVDLTSKGESGESSHGGNLSGTGGVKKEMRRMAEGERVLTPLL